MHPEELKLESDELCAETNKHQRTKPKKIQKTKREKKMCARGIARKLKV